MSWPKLNWRGKLNFIFFLINLFTSIVMAYIGSILCVFNLTVSFLCFISFNYAPNCRK